MSKKCFFLFIVLSVLLIQGCSEKQEIVSTEESTVEESPVQIGITFDTFVIERWQRDRDVFVSTCKELGADINVQNANGDVQEQLSQIDYFIEKKVDVLVIVAVDSDSLKNAVAKAKKAGIKVIAYDRMALNANEDLYISFDNEKVGDLMAETMISELPDGGPILVINGPKKDHNVEMMNEGFNKTIQDRDIRIVASAYMSEWKGEEAFQYLNDHPSLLYNIKGIVCGNDTLAGQTIRALSERRLAGKVVVVGQDADLDACQRIVEGTQTMTVYKPIEKLAKKAAECAVAMAEGKQFETETISDGTYMVPYIGIEPVTVTKDNIDEVVIDSGFHLREDVYLNMPEQNLQ